MVYAGAEPAGRADRRPVPDVREALRPRARTRRASRASSTTCTADLQKVRDAVSADDRRLLDEHATLRPRDGAGAAATRRRQQLAPRRARARAGHQERQRQHPQAQPDADRPAGQQLRQRHGPRRHAAVHQLRRQGAGCAGSASTTGTTSCRTSRTLNDRVAGKADEDQHLVLPSSWPTWPSGSPRRPSRAARASLLDNTLIVWTNELGKGNSHTLERHPLRARRRRAGLQDGPLAQVRAGAAQPAAHRAGPRRRPRHHDLRQPETLRRRRPDGISIKHSLMSFRNRAHVLSILAALWVLTDALVAQAATQIYSAGNHTLSSNIQSSDIPPVIVNGTAHLTVTGSVTSHNFVDEPALLAADGGIVTVLGGTLRRSRGIFRWFEAARWYSLIGQLATHFYGWPNRGIRLRPQSRPCRDFGGREFSRFHVRRFSKRRDLAVSPMERGSRQAAIHKSRSSEVLSLPLGLWTALKRGSRQAAIHNSRSSEVLSLPLGPDSGARTGLAVSGNSQVSIFGGSVLAAGSGFGARTGLAVSGNSQVSIFGGSILAAGAGPGARTELDVLNNAVITIYGSGFSFPYGPIEVPNGTLLGNLSDGSQIQWRFTRSSDAKIVLAVPEPGALILGFISAAVVMALARRRSSGFAQRAQNQ